MATLWLTCRRPFDREDIPVNADIRRAIRDQIVSWTGWSGNSTHSVQWTLAIQSVPVTRRDCIVYFCWNYGSDSVVRSSVLSQIGQGGLTPDSEQALRQAHANFAAQSQSMPAAGRSVAAGATAYPSQSSAVSEVWMRHQLYLVFGFQMTRPPWTRNAIARIARYFATNVLHEVGHNKVAPARRRVNPNWNLHDHGGGGVFQEAPPPGIAPSGQNLQLLEQNFDASVQQVQIAHPTAQ